MQPSRTGNGGPEETFRALFTGLEIFNLYDFNGLPDSISSEPSNSFHGIQIA